MADFQGLCDAIATAAKSAFVETLKAKPNEQLFVFVLSTLDDATYVSASVNSEENHRKVLSESGVLTDSAEEEYFRWTPGEWAENEYIGQEHFKPVDALLEAMCAEMGEDGFDDYRKGVLQAMQDALARLDAEQLWGTGEDRENVTLFVTIYDSDDMGELEEKSARALNPPATFARFQRRHEKTEAEVARVEAEKREQRSSVLELPVKEQVDHWVSQLLCLARDADADLYGPDAPASVALEALQTIGRAAVPAMLEMVGSTVQEDDTKVDTIRFRVLQTVSKIGDSGPQVHMMLAQLLKRFCERNEGLTKWQTTPFHIADCLHKLIPGYPSPSMEGNNAIAEHTRFIAVTQKHGL